MKFRFPGIIALLAFTLHAGATVRLPAVIGDNMVLQQQSNVPLWGTARTGATVSITTSWDHHRYTVRADAGGKWKTEIATPAAGGPYEIVFSDGEPLRVSNVLIGEVWVCSGQSNMEISLKGYANQPVLNGNDIIAHAGNPQLRLFHLKRAVSHTPLEDAGGSWAVSAPEAAAGFSAVGFQFAKMLQETLHVPVGIIESSWGGTPIEAWMNRQSLQGFPQVKLPAAGAKPSAHSPTDLFNAMINPIAGYGIKGFLWYQGEANRSRSGTYAGLMAAMVQSWRQLWGGGTLPFYFVQIAPWAYPDHQEGVALLREAQYRASQDIPHSGMVVSMDVGSKTTIHPPDKTTIARRLLYWALGDTYGQKGIAYKTPAYRGIKTAGDSAVIVFSDIPGGLTTFGKPLDGFEVAGADKEFHPATARVVKSTVVVRSDAVPHPVAVRYVFKAWAVGTLFSTDGLPVAPFRTDDW
ncbi:sialate O-acetylesterase [Compostibacter hankyongensis]|uniref:Sialate O-acetylesterase n=1 Tax=Compostibacter hankyongensis TaxID=1007089 RepID=A0ABP8FUW8_9BACT